MEALAEELCVSGTVKGDGLKGRCNVANTRLSAARSAKECSPMDGWWAEGCNGVELFCDLWSIWI